jgi:hypothetical protein
LKYFCISLLFLNGLGIGTLYSQTGVYVGHWSGGLQNGRGKSFFNNGNSYEGDYKDGFKDGKGTFKVQVRIQFAAFLKWRP